MQKNAREVVNFGICVEQFLKKQTSLLFGFHSDYNSDGLKEKNIDNNDISFTFFNLWHGTMGISFTQKNKKITIGLAGAYGSLSNQLQIANFTAPSDDTFLIGKTSYNSNYTYKSIALVIGLVL